MKENKELVKIIGTNHISRYIPLMIDATDKCLKSIKRDEQINISFEVTKIIFRIIAKIIFGADVDWMPPIQYTSPKTGETSKLPLEEFYFRYAQDEFDGYMSSKGVLLPLFAKYNLIEPYKSNYKNNRSLLNSIRDFLATTKDSESVYKRVEALGKFSYEAILNDMVMLLFGGFDTTSHLVWECLYWLKI